MKIETRTHERARTDVPPRAGLELAFPRPSSVAAPAAPGRGLGAEHGRVPEITPWLQRLFGIYARRWIRKGFHGLRLARRERLAIAPGDSVLIYLNHPSWWDPLICFALSRELFPERRHFAPMEASALARYRFLERVGLFPVEGGSVRGARAFLEKATAIATTSDCVLWMTPQGRFHDSRERPPRFRSGLGRLASGLRARSRPRTTVIVPLAIELTYWEERFPEALALVGGPLELAQGPIAARDWTRALEEQLARAQDELAALAAARRIGEFETLVTGRAGIGGIYDLGRKLHARIRGERFDRRHGTIR